LNHFKVVILDYSKILQSLYAEDIMLYIYDIVIKFRIFNIIGYGSHAKGRTHIEGIEKGRKPKT
jgi:hypothetical protein